MLVGSTLQPHRSFTPEFKADIVVRCHKGDRSIGDVAKDFDLTETHRTTGGPTGPATPLAVGPIHVCHTGLLEARGC